MVRLFLLIEYVRTGDISDVRYVQDECRFSKPHCYQNNAFIDIEGNKRYQMTDFSLIPSIVYRSFVVVVLTR